MKAHIPRREFELLDVDNFSDILIDKDEVLSEQDLKAIDLYELETIDLDELKAIYLDFDSAFSHDLLKQEITLNQNKVFFINSDLNSKAVETPGDFDLD